MAEKEIKVKPAEAEPETEPAKQETGKVRKPFSWRKALRIAGWTAGGLLVVLILAFIFRDPLIELGVKHAGSFLTGTKVTEAETDYYHFDYNEGKPVDVRTNLDDTGLFLLDGVSNATYVSGGFFTVSVVLDETKASRENYRWEDGAEITGPVIFNVVIDPVDYTLPASVAAATLYAETDYRPGGTYEYDDAWLALTTATRTYLIEQGVWIDGGVSLYSVDELMIGANAVVSDGAFICTASHDISSGTFELETSPVAIGDSAWVCAKATVWPGVKVGEGAIVAAGSVVAKDVEPWTVVGGNPAKFIKKRVLKES